MSHVACGVLCSAEVKLGKVCVFVCVCVYVVWSVSLGSSMVASKGVAFIFICFFSVCLGLSFLFVTAVDDFAFGGGRRTTTTENRRSLPTNAQVRSHESAGHHLPRSVFSRNISSRNGLLRNVFLLL